MGAPRIVTFGPTKLCLCQIDESQRQRSHVSSPHETRKEQDSRSFWTIIGGIIIIEAEKI
jgi:hypothetical protein